MMTSVVGWLHGQNMSPSCSIGSITQTFIYIMNSLCVYWSIELAHPFSGYIDGSRIEERLICTKTTQFVPIAYNYYYFKTMDSRKKKHIVK